MFSYRIQKIVFFSLWKAWCHVMEYVIAYDLRKKNGIPFTPWHRRCTQVNFESDSVDNLAKALQKLKQCAELSGEEMVVRHIVEDKLSYHYSKNKEALEKLDSEIRKSLGIEDFETKQDSEDKEYWEWRKSMEQTYQLMLKSFERELRYQVDKFLDEKVQSYHHE